jgi:hypothetical protein
MMRAAWPGRWSGRWTGRRRGRDREAIQSAGPDETLGILRLRMRFRFANADASLRMTECSLAE